MRIGIDIDDTMTDTFDYLIPYVSEFFKIDIDYLIKNNISYTTFTDDMKKRKTEFEKKYYDLVIPNTPFKKEVSEYIKKIKNLGHEIIIITARDNSTYKDAYKMTTDALRSNGIIYDKLICNRNKTKICKDEKIDLFIDDSTVNCDAVNKLGIKTLLFNSKGNIDIQTNLDRVGSWNELYNLIKDKLY